MTPSAGFSALPWFAGLHIVAGQIRRLAFEARDADEARTLAAQWQVGVEGETARYGLGTSAPLPEAYDEKTARKILGGISKSTLYRLIAKGKLARLSGTFRVLVTRASIETFCRTAKSSWSC